jgi:hypothetical protein
MKKPRRKGRPRRSSGGSPSGGTVSQLRNDMDRSRTGEKVDRRDLAAPLGTDEEAAGTRPSPAAVNAARRRERGRPAVARSERRHPRASWVQVAIVAVLIAAAVGWIASQYLGGA